MEENRKHSMVFMGNRLLPKHTKRRAISIADRDRIILAAMRDKVKAPTIARGFGLGIKAVYSRMAKLTTQLESAANGD